MICPITGKECEARGCRERPPVIGEIPMIDCNLLTVKSDIPSLVRLIPESGASQDDVDNAMSSMDADLRAMASIRKAIDEKGGPNGKSYVDRVLYIIEHSGDVWSFLLGGTE